MYREPGMWKGPYILVSKEGTTGMVNIRGRVVSFCATLIKPYYNNNDEGDSKDDSPEDKDQDDQMVPLDAQLIDEPRRNLPRTRGRPKKFI